MSLYFFYKNWYTLTPFNCVIYFGFQNNDAKKKILIQETSLDDLNEHDDSISKQIWIGPVTIYVW